MRPAPPVQIVYLDLNHWISLAKAAVGHSDGARYVDSLETLRRARATGRFVFPLSASHYMEMSGVRNARHRADVAAVMEELSGFASLVDRLVVMRLELEAALDALTSRLGFPYAPVPVVGQGVLQAMGKVGGLLVRNSDGEDVTDEVRGTWPQGPEHFDRWRADAERQLDRSVLRGPRDDAEAASLRADGWDPTAARRFAEERAAGEREQAGRLAAEPRWRRGRLRDVVAARYVIFEILNMVEEALAQRGLEFSDVWTDLDASRRIVDCMPSADVCVTLLTSGHRNPQTAWTPNDIFDIDALSVAVAYCDVVVTERHASRTLQVAGAPKRLGTIVVTALDELVDVLGLENSP
jgi:hypothetical protein